MTDDGAGFAVGEAQGRPSQSVGLFGMAERVALVGGSFEIESRPERGTCVRMTVPIGEEVSR